MVKVKYKAWYIVVKFENNPLRIVGNIKLLVIFTANEQTDKQKDYTLPPFGGEVQQRLAH